MINIVVQQLKEQVAVLGIHRNRVDARTQMVK